MVGSQLKGKFVPDRHGKLKPVLKLTEIDVGPPVLTSRRLAYRIPVPSPAGRLWLWVKNRIL